MTAPTATARSVLLLLLLSVIATRLALECRKQKALFYGLENAWKVKEMPRVTGPPEFLIFDFSCFSELFHFLVKIRNACRSSLSICIRTLLAACMTKRR